jgi:alkanesulfonate monooxygenase SsuD/methylene tetrahydromethanopterin reductase-like flavin-dependent oxidoreductase (luciferase family)
MRTYLAEAEEFRFESAWTGEQVLGTLPLLSPLEVLSYAAAYTQWIRLGCAMLVSPLHNPVHLVKTIASVDQLSRGRLLTSGWSPAARFACSPHSKSTRPATWPASARD